ncbi:T-cell immunoglobulin and mucin domain-containing protein 4-like isoform X2 [Dicentrarchus labrax]|uniref:T-cell immunoglobulin and mucin domain-containing protein 4-like isoform X2 n=1 Tax=Dicentrarchus labrax TaxID=13489 RepID=UPI0021F61A9C|nr:T-cell immunoglobulin and mucin domain-containing protein 4-like isoform X2 [Dicentrarchus labrax]
MKIALLLALLTVSECSSSAVVGWRGHNVTFSCRYDIKYHGPEWMCWNRGEIPSRGCDNPLISTDGRTVTTRASSRYQLLGRLDEGDVSMTILNLTQTDSGRYGCRVQIPGAFNDIKHHFDLTVERGEKQRAPLTTSSTPSSSSSSSSTRETSTEQTDNDTTGQLTSTETMLTSSSSSGQLEGSSVTVVLVCVLFGLIALVTAGAIIIIARRWKQINKIRQQQVHRSVQFSSTSSSLELHRRSAVENIYNIDTDRGGDGGEYEYCP